MRALNAGSALPDSFQDALKTGWKIIHEESTSSADERERCGVLLLGRKGASARLRVVYTETTKSWKFEAPQVIEESLAA
jgi:hypothetical protein